MKITRQEIRWMLNIAEKDRDNSKFLKDMPEQKYKALHALEYENMATLAKKLEDILNNDRKRIDII